MLCKICERAIQAAAKRFSRTQHLGGDVQDSLAETPSHISLRSFYNSIQEGCALCRQLWAQILWESSDSLSRPPGRASLWAPFLDDLEFAAPTKFGDLNRQCPGLTNGAAVRNPSTLRPLIKKRAFATACAVQGLFLHCASITRNRSFIRYIMAAQERLNQRAECSITFRGYYFTVKSFTHNTSTVFDLSPVDPIGKNAVNASDLRSEVASSSMPSSMGLWLYWYRTCVSTHSKCNVARHSLQPFVPKRLIQILPEDQSGTTKWKLNCNPADGAISYLTLSHCWGSSQPIRLEKDNISVLCAPNEISLLPKTYQDALMVTQSLRFQYIWIDSICIIQDDEEDWEVQSSLMGSIYSHAACNIAATWASDGSKGCFGNGDLAAKSPTFLTLRGSSGGSYQVWHDKSYEADVIHAPLNKRGWVIQERYLARQQLSFAQRQVYWECRELMASEQFPAGLPESISKHQACLEFENEFEARKAWNHIVELYSNCQLTKKSDKLVAISGLAQALQESIHDDYICGLWRKDLHHQLLGVSEGDNGLVTTTYGQIAPTWSWANIDGPVLFLKDHLLAKSIESMPWMEVLGIPAGPTNRLSLRGIAVRSHIQISDDRNILSHEFRHILDRSIRKLITKVFNLHLSEYNRLYSAPDVVLDSYNDLQRNRDFDLIFFMICRDYGVDQGLVLRKLPPITDGRMQYVRIGVFWTDPAFMDPYWKHVADRLGLPEPDIYGMDRPLDLDDPRLADLVHTVHIV